MSPTYWYSILLSVISRMIAGLQEVATTQVILIDMGLILQGQGFGGKMLSAMEQELRQRRLRPIRLESAVKAVNFFKTQNYKEIGEPMNCVCSGSALFRTLQRMEKFSKM